jgi:DNA-binding FrmR family transcriptional regulator
MKPDYKSEAALRLKITAGHLEGVRRMVDDEAYCVDLMKQLSAVQASLEKVQQIFLRNHLSTCVSDAIQDGMGEEIIDELMGALKFNKSLTDGRYGVTLDETVHVLAVGEGDTAPSGAACCRPAAAVALPTPPTARA